jgi:hypothetical protein
VMLAAILAAAAEGSNQSHRHSGAMRQHRTRNLEIPGLVLRTIPE